MARGVHAIVSARRSAASSSVANTPASNPLLVARPVVERVHIQATLTATPAKYYAGEMVIIQLRTYIWIPGKVLNVIYNEEYKSYVYNIEFVAADGCRHRSGFFPQDVRDYTVTDAVAY
ncbi:hypothetical protein C8Q74DRAFT_1366484 [Fomes fomentarius]|nr:hypothetical protein C8Q74DRAFT_1366484 [Fomes fomentarius]